MTDGWQLYIDESGDFSQPNSDISVGALLVRGTWDQARARLDVTLRDTLPFLPRPLHAAHLNNPAFIALCWMARGPGCLKASERRRLSAGALAAIDALTVGAWSTPAAAAPFAQELQNLARTLKSRRRQVLFGVADQLLGTGGQGPLTAQLGEWSDACRSFAEELTQRRAPLAGWIEQLSNGRHPDWSALMTAWHQFRSSYGAQAEIIRSVQLGLVVHIERTIRAANLSEHGAVAVCCGQPRRGALATARDRYLPMLQATLHRAAILVQADSIAPLDVAVATRDVVTPQGVVPLDETRVGALFPSRTAVSSASRPRQLHVVDYWRADDLGLELADWISNRSRRELALKRPLENVESVITRETGFATRSTSGSSLTSVGRPEAWLIEHLETGIQRPPDRPGERQWTWDQAAEWAGTLSTRPSTGASANTEGADV